MKCTEDNIIYVNKRQKLDKHINKTRKKGTSSILEIINNHKFITTIVAMFVTFSILNIILIVNFITVLGENIHM
ncbi:MAG: hypothetical protein HFJ48_06715 [Clostridia bacterium]|nr:hypothetical protein [Clostridia bacterium]